MLPQIFSDYYLNIGIIVGIYIILSMGLDITIGYAGQPSLGHAAFWAMGAFASAIFTAKYGLSFWVSLPLSVLFTGLVGVLLGLPSLRVKEDFLVIVTLGLCLVVQSLAQHLPLTGGALGISNVPKPSLFGYKFSVGVYFLFVLAWVFLCGGMSRIIDRSWMGLAFRSIRDDEIAAEIMGIHISRLKVLAFAIGAAYAGLAGVLYAHFMNFVSAEMFGLNESVTILSMIVIGGLASIRGAVLGALLLGTAPETMRWAADYRMSIIGILMFLVIIFQPEGLFGRRSLWVSLKSLWTGTRS
jgi:branched-chain amino acid transport system permease protein